VPRYGVQAGIGDPEFAGGVDRQPMHEAGELPLAPRGDEVAIRIEHQHRMRGTAQHIDVAVGGDGALHGGARRAGQVGLAEIPPARQLRPVALEAVTVGTGADDGVCHMLSSAMCRYRFGYTTGLSVQAVSPAGGGWQ
jgi:hypothetical protein